MKTDVAVKLRLLLLILFIPGFIVLSACRAPQEESALRWSEPVFAGIPDGSLLGELSGLARSNSHPGLIWTINDGGNEAEIIAINTSAKTKARIRIEGVQNIDWEDITSYQLGGRNFLAIADTGDNGGIRKDLFIHIVEEPVTLDIGSVKPTRSLRFRWKDGARDNESLFASGDSESFYLISKKRVPAELYQLPINAPDGSSPTLLTRLEGIAQPDAKTMNTKGDFGRYRSQITGADLSPDGQIIAVLNYQKVYFYKLPDKPVPNIFPISSMDLPWLPQAEGIAFSNDGKSLFIGSEEMPSPLIRFEQIESKP
jgi:hypothetical protein